MVLLDLPPALLVRMATYLTQPASLRIETLSVKSPEYTIKDSYNALFLIGTLLMKMAKRPATHGSPSTSYDE